MRKAILLALLLLACSKKSASGKPPVIDSFTVDNAGPQEGDSITFSYQVTDATTVRIDPLPGLVTASPVTVTPFVGGDFTLTASNGAGSVTQVIGITVNPAVAVAINQIDALPAQVAAGAQVTLSWKVTAAASLSLSDGSSSKDVTGLTSLHVNPTKTTVYTLTAQARPNHTPASASAHAVARVEQPAVVASFTASPAAITQGQASTLSWSGTASSWSVSDGSTTRNLGPLRSLVVRPAVSTTYTLLATGPAGTLSPAPTAAVSVTPHPASALAYTEAAASSMPLKLTAISCSASSCTLALVAASAVLLRGVALDLPADSTKVALDPASLALNTAVIGDSPPAARVALGQGPLQDTIVFGAAIKGTGTAPAADVPLSPGAEIARFVLTLLPAGGSGPVFDGTTAAGSAAIASYIQNASGRSAAVIAVGKLEAN